MIDNHNGSKQHTVGGQRQDYHTLSPHLLPSFLHWWQTGSMQISGIFCYVWMWYRGKILAHTHRCLILTLFWQNMCGTETHFSLICISGYLETHTYVHLTHLVTCATCITLLDNVPCRASSLAFSSMMLKT